MPRQPNANLVKSVAARFRRTRAAHHWESAEDYVEAIAQLSADGEEARVRDLSAMMGISHVSVSRMVRRLADRGLVEARDRGPIRLTPTGRRLAAKGQARHDAVLEFLLAIGVPRVQAEIDAEGIEHHVSQATIRALTAWTATRASPAHPGPGASG